MANIKPGIYRHFKGKEYEIFGIALDNETKLEYVFYRMLYGDYSFWIRPVDMFLGNVPTEKGLVKRFSAIRLSNYQTEFSKIKELTGNSVFKAKHSETQEYYIISRICEKEHVIEVQRYAYA